MCVHNLVPTCFSRVWVKFSQFPAYSKNPESSHSLDYQSIKNQMRVTPWISSQSNTKCESLPGFPVNKKPDASHSLDFLSIKYQMRVTPWISSQSKTRCEALAGFTPTSAQQPFFFKKLAEFSANFNNQYNFQENHFKKPAASHSLDLAATVNYPRNNTKIT